MYSFYIIFFIQIFFSWDVYSSTIGKKFSCNHANSAFLDKVNKDYVAYQRNEQKKDNLTNNLTFARQVLQHYKDYFNINCSTVFGGSLASKVCAEDVISTGLASDRKEMARELLNHCAFRAYGETINKRANDKINSLEGKTTPPRCESDLTLKMYYTVAGGCKNNQIKTSNDWGCDIYNSRKNLSMTGWPQADPLQIKRTMAQYVYTHTTDLVPSTCKVKIEGTFFNNFICSKDDILKQASTMKNALSKFKKDDPNTHISDNDYKKFKTSLELLEYCASDVFPEAQQWAKEKMVSFKDMRKHEAILLKEKKSCSDVDLRKESKSKNNILPPIRDQDSVGWCFAYTGADFISYYMGKSLSALAFSVKNYQEELKKEGNVLSNLAGGNLKHLLEKLKNSGNLCTEEQVNSEDITLTGGYRYQLQKTLKSLEDFVSQTEQKDEVSFFCGIRNHLSKLFPNLNMQDFIDILKSEDENTVLIAAINKACDKKDSIPLPKDFSIALNNHMNLDELHEILDRKDLFVATFDVSLLVSDMERTNHMSSIVGRRYNKDKNRCEFLLKNSWGETCYPQYKHECDKGYLWIPEKDLMGGLKAVYYKE